VIIVTTDNNNNIASQIEHYGVKDQFLSRKLMLTLKASLFERTTDKFSLK
jgi:spore coat protein CotF